MEAAAPWVTGFLFAFPVLAAAYPPMSDLPLHEASVGLLRHWGDARFSPPTLYMVNLGHANQLFSMLDLLLSYVVPIGWASKIVVAASLIGLPVAAGHFASHLGAPRWTALLVAPLGLGWLFFWGLVQNLLGLVVLLAFLPTIDQFAQAPTLRGASKVCGVMLLLHFAHEAMQVVALTALVLCCVGTPMRARWNVLRALPVAFCALIVFAANWYSWHVAGPRLVNTDLFVFYTFGHKLETIPGVLFGGYEPTIRNLMMVVAAAPLVVYAAARIRQREAAASYAARIHSLRFEILALLLFCVYLVAPANIKSTTLVYHRFLPPAWAIGAVCIPKRRGLRWPRVAPLLCALVPLASLAIAWPPFADSNRVYSSLDAIVNRIEVGSAVMALNLGPSIQNRLWDPLVSAGHVVAQRGGRSLYDYTQSPVSPVTMRPGKEWGEVMDRVKVDIYNFRPKWDFTHFRYLLIATSRPTLAEAFQMALSGAARLVVRSGDWYLFESVLPLVPVDSDDAPLPIPPPPSLHKLLRDVARDLREREAASGDGAVDIPAIIPDDSTMHRP